MAISRSYCQLKAMVTIRRVYESLLFNVCLVTDKYLKQMFTVTVGFLLLLLLLVEEVMVALEQ